MTAFMPLRVRVAVLFAARPCLARKGLVALTRLLGYSPTRLAPETPRIRVRGAGPSLSDWLKKDRISFYSDRSLS